MAGKSSEYWHSKNNGAQIYYGTAQNNRVNIGQENDIADDAAASRLVINTGTDEQNHILFKRSGTNLLGFLKLDTRDNMCLGGTPLRETDTTSYGIRNTGIGIGTLQSLTTGTNNTAIGYASLHSNTANNNTAVGYHSLSSNTTGSYNTAVSYGSLRFNTTGNYNTAIGYYACRNVTTGSNKICIGYNSGPASGSPEAENATNQVWIGTSDSTVYIPGKLTVTGTTTGPSETWTKSDIRLKNVKGENKSGLEKIKQLKVFNYTLKDDKKKTPRVGVIAQDLQKIFPDAVTKDEKGYLLIRMEDMFYALVNAVKELDKKVNEILRCAQNDSKAKDAKIKELEKRIQKLEAKLQ
jgi:hypothetical protein